MGKFKKTTSTSRQSNTRPPFQSPVQQASSRQSPYPHASPPEQIIKRDQTLSYTANPAMPIPGLYGDIDNKAPGHVALKYYVDPSYWASMQKHKQAGSPMRLAVMFSDPNLGESQEAYHHYHDLTGIVKGPSSRHTPGTDHTEMTLCTPDIQTDICAHLPSMQASTIPRAFEIFSTLAPCSEYCLPHYLDHSYLQSWQVDAFLNHTAAQRQLTESTDITPGFRLPNDPQRWQNYNWLVIFDASDPKDPLPCYALCTRMLKYFNRASVDMDNQPTRWLSRGYVNGLVELSHDPSEIRDWTPLFFEEKNRKNTIYKGLDLLSQEYVYWFLSGHNYQHNSNQPHLGHTVPSIHPFMPQLEEQFLSPRTLLQRILPDYHPSAQPAFLMALIMTAVEQFLQFYPPQTSAYSTSSSAQSSEASASSPGASTGASTSSTRKRQRNQSPYTPLLAPEDTSDTEEQSSKRAKKSDKPQASPQANTTDFLPLTLLDCQSFCAQLIRLQNILEQRGQTIQNFLDQYSHYLVPALQNDSPSHASSVATQSSSSRLSLFPPSHSPQRAAPSLASQAPQSQQNTSTAQSSETAPQSVQAESTSTLRRRAHNRRHHAHRRRPDDTSSGSAYKPKR